MSEYGALLILPHMSGVFSVMSGPLFFGILFFFIPAFLLGVVSPYVIKLQSQISKNDEIGTVVGMTFFWGTFGSIFGSLLTGFVLVPYLGVTKSVVSTGVILVLLGIGGLMYMRKLYSQRPDFSNLLKHKQQLFILCVLCATILLCVLIQSVGFSYPHTVVHRSDGLYSQLLVYEIGDERNIVRALKQDTNNSSATHLSSYDLIFGYTQFSEFYFRLKPDTENFLMIGAGTYSVPRTLVARNPQIEVTVSELEPTLLPLAQQYFDLHDVSRIHTEFVDGRVLLTRSTTTYDIIFGDAFGTDHSIPAHLATREFFIELKKDLAPEGIFMLNYIGTLNTEAPTLTGSLLKTLQSVFPNIKMYAFEKETPLERQNIMFIARNGIMPINLEGAQIRLAYGKHLSVSDMEVSLSQFESEAEYLLTDDHAPIEYLMLAQN